MNAPLLWLAQHPAITLTAIAGLLGLGGAAVAATFRSNRSSRREGDR